MILRISFGDNDFTQFIEEFLDEYRRSVYVIALSIMKKYDKDKDLQEYVHTSIYIDELMARLYGEDKRKKDDIQEFIELFKEAFLFWLSNNNNCKESMDYLINNLTVINIRSVKSEWRNMEVVYWFTDYRKYITM